jgi:hypothetical protein
VCCNFMPDAGQKSQCGTPIVAPNHEAKKVGSTPSGSTHITCMLYINVQRKGSLVTPLPYRAHSARPLFPTFLRHTRPRDHHPSMTSPLGCRAAPLGTPTANTLFSHHEQHRAQLAKDVVQPRLICSMRLSARTSSPSLTRSP